MWWPHSTRWPPAARCRSSGTHPPKGNTPPLKSCFFGAMPSPTLNEPKSSSTCQAWVAVPALELMENMLSLLGPDDGGFLFAHLFLRQLPAAVRAVLANSPLLPAKDYRSLAEEADRILLASRTFNVHAVATDSPATPSTPPPASPGASAPLLTAGIATRPHGGKNICFYHQRFGDRARRCLPPCAFTAQGNGPASAP
ncbi:unnamed protein product [Oreochromis niloticus]|nr:unnamed protein product [Mustela putorius furo]